MRSHLQEAATTKTKIDDLFEISAETSLIGSYTRNATRERTAADRWRMVAIAAAAVAIAIGLWAALVAAQENSDWDLLAAKALLGAVVAGLFAYAARQSAEHRNSQRDAEHVAVQLAALKPYLSDLSEPAERDKLLIVIAQRLFGQARVNQNHDDSVARMLADDPNLLTAIASAVAAARK